MNFLAHYVHAARHAPAGEPSPAYVLGNALPDLLPLAAPRARFRPSTLQPAPGHSLKVGVLMHLRTDSAFHKAEAFARAQADVTALFHKTAFPGMRLRPFFLSHVSVELALDAALLRAEPALADDFYTAFAAADFSHAAHWAEMTLQRRLPSLTSVLSHFARSRYLCRYLTDDGVAEGLTRLCARARQETFTGDNFTRLTALTAEAVGTVAGYAPDLFAQTQRLWDDRGQPT